MIQNEARDNRELIRRSIIAKPRQARNKKREFAMVIKTEGNRAERYLGNRRVPDLE
jgi:hypothetical protein